MTIKECAEIHRALWYTENLGVAQGYGPSPRDRELLVVLANKLGIPDEKFITSDESKKITAQKYLTAMLEIMEPLSQMFQDIWIYCERTLIRTSKNALDIEWNFNINGKSIAINFEAFRKYQKLLNKTLDKDKFNEVCNEFTTVCCKHNDGKGYIRYAPMPLKPDDADPTSVVSRIHDMCKHVKEEGLIDDGYYGATDAIPYLSAMRSKNLWRQEDFAELKPLVEDFYNSTKLEDILSLPFWTFRWQIYELWCLIITLQLFESRGFTLVQSSDGASLLELGQKVVVAEKNSNPLGQIIYQPSYRRTTGQCVHPDIVVVQGHPEALTPNIVRAIVECKQHKMPENERFLLLKKRYFDGVAEAYNDSIGPDGKLVLLNYDKVDFTTNYALLDDFKPQNISPLKGALSSILDEYSANEEPRQIVLVVDGSQSMLKTLVKSEEYIKELHKVLGAFDEVIWLRGGNVHVENINRFDYTSFYNIESVDLFLAGIDRANQFGSNISIHLITDLKPQSEILNEVLKEAPKLHIHYIS
ncbi:hypothetical protein H0261_02130 [Pectobacterium versatile]|uniref:hypothetical protein n=1 Tax=Pectobacterium TaxID=122277 RepID=UPI000F631A01|nr:MULTISPECIES: hypothetical protein [Pectobacterium]MBA0182529.1 hypothetical protein [Pectobacterium versatile]RRO01950.1 hypothetical protein DMB83_012000 [Pectobacterium aquaticum]